MKEVIQIVDECMLIAFGKRAFLVRNINGDGDVMELKHENSSDDEASSSIETIAMMKGIDDDGTMHCVVSYQDKQIAIHHVLLTDRATTTKSIIQHQVPKRVASLTFALIATKNQASPSSPVLLAGDLAGDVWAFSLHNSNQRRLLLGHTASMITGLCTMTLKKHDGDDGNNRAIVLSADRDEKVRISQFPNTEYIDGYLLGHTAFITSMLVCEKIDEQQQQQQTAITASADGTIRIWDLESMECLSTTEVGRTQDDENNKNNNDDTSDQQQWLIPTCISINHDATVLAVIYDESNQIDFFTICSNKLSSSLSTIKCDAQPLSIQFQNDANILHAVLQSPHYIAFYEVTENAADVKPSETLTKLKQLAIDEKIETPSTIIEKDQRGLPKLRKLNETRGPGGDDKPWERVERIEIAKNREKRAKQKKKRQKLDGTD